MCTTGVGADGVGGGVCLKLNLFVVFFAEIVVGDWEVGLNLLVGF